MREFRKYNNNDHHHRKHYHRQHGGYNNSHNEGYKTNPHHNRINKYNNRNSYQYHDERDSQVRVKISNLDYTISKNDLVVPSAFVLAIAMALVAAPAYVSMIALLMYTPMFLHHVVICFPPLLQELFSNVCKVVNAWINYDHTDRSDGTGVCVFENINDAQKAIDKYDG